MQNNNVINTSRASANRTDGVTPRISGRARIRHTLTTIWKCIPFSKPNTPITVAIDNKKLEIIKNQARRPRMRPDADVPSSFTHYIKKNAFKLKDTAVSWFNKGHNKKFALAAGVLGAAYFAYNAFTFRPHTKLISEIKGEHDAVISNKYQRGYDTIKEYMTDFGSPLHLAKTVRKTITPYLSSTRKGVITNTNAVINSNPALYASKNAIGHHRY